MEIARKLIKSLSTRIFIRNLEFGPLLKFLKITFRYTHYPCPREHVRTRHFEAFHTVCLDITLANKNKGKLYGEFPL